MTVRELRPYQQEALDAVLHTWGSNVMSTAVCLPTGTGKSTVIASLAATAARMDLPVVMMAHRAELLDQMAATVHDVDPGLPPVGIVRADRNECTAPIVAASLQTLTNPDRQWALGPRRVILWDEVHHAGAETWRTVLENFSLREQAFFCGFSATLRRDDGHALRSVIDTVAYERTLRWAIDTGYLVRPHGLTVKIPDLDLGKVKVTAGDFQQSGLAEIMESETPEVVKAILTNCKDRRPIIFAASVLAAEEIANELNLGGMTAQAVTGAMSYEERQPIYAEYRAGTCQALVTVMVLTEGADFPMCDCAVIARPTQSQNLYSQMVGRALRLWPGKEDALVLDLVGTSRVLKLVTLADLDAGSVSKPVTPEGVELPPEDYEDAPMADGLGPVKSRRLGPIDMVGIDLLGPGDTNVLWLATTKGIPFFQPAAGEHFVFLWPQMDGAYKAGYMTNRGRRDGGWVDDRAWNLVTAKELAEDWAAEQGMELPRRAASWRRPQAPSDPQLNFARTLGITNGDTMTKARLSDEISVHLVSQRLDPR